MSEKCRILLFSTRRRGALGFTNEVMKELLDTCHVETLLGMDENDLTIGHPAPFHPVKLSGFREYLWQFLYFYKLFPFLEKFDPEYLTAPHLFKGINSRMRRTITALRQTHLLRFVAYVSRAILILTNPYRSLVPKYDLVIAYGGIKDPWFDDITRWAHSHKISVLCVPTNWDNLPGKPFVERPDYVGVWGAQSVYFARLCHGFLLKNIFQLGVNRFENHYAAAKTPKDQWRKKLGLPEKGKMLLFAGAGETFNETPLLKILDEALDNAHFGPDVYSVYKTHPVTRIKGLEHVDETLEFKKIIRWPEINESGADNSALLAACDAVITPYSTMMLEGAYFGTPSLTIYYNDPKFPGHDWYVYARNSSHIPMFVAPWAVKCNSPKTFLVGLENLMTKIGDQNIQESARRDYDHCVYRDSFSYGLRLLTSVENIMGKRLFWGEKPAHVVVDPKEDGESLQNISQNQKPMKSPLELGVPSHSMQVNSEL